MNEQKGKSGGGAATQGGISFQNRVAAWVCVQMLAEKHATPVGPAAIPAYVRFETQEAVDDLLVGTVDGGHAFVQAKRTLSLSSGDSSDFATVIDQFVRQYLSSRNASSPRPWSQALDPTRDRLVLATSPESPATLRGHLAAVTDRLHGLAPGQPLSDAAVNQLEQEALTALIQQIKKAWQSALNVPPSDTDIIGVAKLIYIAVLDVERDGAAEREALNILSATVVHHAEQAGAAWARILQLAGDLAQRRGGTDIAGAREALQSAGIPLKTAPRYEKDVAKLKSQTLETIRYLEHNSRIPIGGNHIRIQRAVVNAIKLATETDSIVLVGVPGAGKSGVVHDYAELLSAEGRDVVFLAADQIGAKSLGELRNELCLEHQILEVILNWPGDRAGFVVIDALDATRGDPAGDALLTLMRAIINANTRWHVVASIRKYDLRYSHELRNLFRGSLSVAVAPELRDSEFSGQRHVNVPLFSDSELAGIRQQSSSLNQLLNGAPAALGDLLRVPFNLRLMADIVDSGVNLTELRPIRTQNELLKRFWIHRVIGNTGGGNREGILRKACELMIHSRRLRTERQFVLGPGLAAPLEELLSGQVLMEWQSPTAAMPSNRLITFAHHILFDFAASQVFLPADSADVPGVLSADPDLVVMIRPSIVMRFEQLWHEDRPEFWRLLFQICRDAHVPPVGKLIGAAVVAESARTPTDLEPIIQRLRSTNADDRTDAESVFKHLVGALTAGPLKAISGTEAGPWFDFLIGVTEQ